MDDTLQKRLKTMNLDNSEIDTEQQASPSIQTSRRKRKERDLDEKVSEVTFFIWISTVTRAIKFMRCSVSPFSFSQLHAVVYRIYLIWLLLKKILKILGFKFLES